MPFLTGGSWHSLQMESSDQPSKQEVKFCRGQLETWPEIVVLVCPKEVRMRAFPGKTTV